VPPLNAAVELQAGLQVPPLSAAAELQAGLQTEL